MLDLVQGIRTLLPVLKLLSDKQISVTHNFGFNYCSVNRALFLNILSLEDILIVLSFDLLKQLSEYVPLC